MASTNNNTQVNVDIGATNSAKSVISDAIKDFANFWKGASGGSDAEGAASSFENLANKIGLTTSKGMLLGGVLAGVVAAGTLAVAVNSVKAAANFQTMTTTLVTTAGETEANIGMIRNGILQLSDTTGASVTDLNTALYTIESAGYHAQSALTIAKAAAQGAAAENANLGEVADAVTSAMRDYNLPASQAANTTSKLVAAVGMGKSNFQDFAGSLHAVLPLASAAHISLNDILGDVASMTVHGMSAEQASQNLANAIRTLQSPSQQATQYLAQIGITASNLSDDLSSKGLSGTLDEISQSIMKNMGPQGKVLIDSFNQSKSAAQDLTTMLNSMPKSLQSVATAYTQGKMSVNDYRTEIKALPTDQANLLQQYVALNNRANGFNNLLKAGSPAALSYSQALQKATGNATTMNVALMLTGENAAYTTKAVDAVGKAHAEAGNNVAGWSIVQKNLNQQLKEAKNSFDNMKIAIGEGLLPVVTAVAKAFASVLVPIAEWMAAHQKLSAMILGAIGVVAALVSSILLISKAISGVTTAVKLLNTAFLMNPWTLVIMALVGLAILVVANWSTVKKWFDRFWKDIKNWFDDGVKFIKEHWMMLVGILLLPIMPVLSAWLMFHTQIKQGFEDAVHWIENIWGDLARGLPLVIKDVKNAITGAVSGFGDMLYDAGKNLIQGLINGIENMAGAAGGAVKKIGSDAVNGIKSLLGIHSPSTVFTEIGQNMGQGLIQGLQGVSAQANVAVTQLVTSNGVMNSNGMPANTAASTNHYVTNSNSSGGNTYYITVQNTTAAAAQGFVQAMNQDTLNLSRGAAPVQGAY